MTKNNRHICPVCGYTELSDPAYGFGDTPSFEICPSCSFQFGKSDFDEGFTFEEWRNNWVKSGMIWDKRRSTPPKDWNPQKQLLNLVGKESKN